MRCQHQSRPLFTFPPMFLSKIKKSLKNSLPSFFPIGVIVLHIGPNLLVHTVWHIVELYTAA